MKKNLILLSLLIAAVFANAQNVGIGTTDPVFKLDVRNGSINTDSVYRIGAISVLSIKGVGNLFTGRYAGVMNTGSNNTFSGEAAGYFNTTGFDNSFFGQEAGYFNTTGVDNSFFGHAAGLSNTTGFNNSFFGQVAGRANTSGNLNSFFGRAAGYSNTTGFDNSFFGHAAGLSNTTGFDNSFFGQFAGYFNTSGNYNSFFGRSAGFSNTTGKYNTANGRSSLSANITGTRNTAVGDSSNVGAGALTNATAIGANARVDCSNCLVLGSVSGVNGASSGVNVGIGTNDPIATLQVARGTGNYGTAAFQGTAYVSHFNYAENEDTYIRAGKLNGNVILNDLTGGKVGIGNSSPTEKLDVSGNIKCVSLIQTSDSRLKTGIVPLQKSLQKIIQLNGYNYYWKDQRSDNSLQTGVLAQEVKKLFPELVREDKEGMLSVNYSGLIPVLIESIKEQQKQIDELKKLVEIFLKK